MSDLRLNRMIASHGLSQEARRKVLERLVEANVAPDDPLSAIFVVEANIEQVAQALASLPDQMAGRLRADLNDSNGALVVGLRESVQSTLNQTSAQAIRRVRRHAVMHLSAGIILAVLAIGGLSLAVGVQLGQDRQASFFKTLAAMPNAEDWERIMISNSWAPELMATICAPGSVHLLPQSDGRTACNVPLWIEDAPVTPIVGFAVRLRAEIIHRFAAMPTWLALLLGALATIAAPPIVRWIATNPRD